MKKFVYQAMVVTFFCLMNARVSAQTYREFRETPQHGTANVICFVTAFDERKNKQWEELAEYYYNVVPNEGVKIQRIYFVKAPKGIAPICSLHALKKSDFISKTFFVCVYDVTRQKYSFARYPFRKK